MLGTSWIFSEPGVNGRAKEEKRRTQGGGELADVLPDVAGDTSRGGGGEEESMVLEELGTEKKDFGPKRYKRARSRDALERDSTEMEGINTRRIDAGRLCGGGTREQEWKWEKESYRQRL